MKTGLAVAGIAALLALPCAAQTPPHDLAALGFLLGDWEAVGTPPGESGAFVFSLAVQDKVIMRTNYAKYDAREGRPASRHDDLMMIFVDGNALKADYVDSEQHVIRYTVEPRGPRHAVFISDAKPSEPRYRLTYSVGDDGLLAGLFEIATPDSPDAFKPYLSWKARKHR